MCIMLLYQWHGQLRHCAANQKVVVHYLMVSLPIVSKSGSLHILEPSGSLIGLYRNCFTFFIRFSICLKYTHEAEALSHYSDWVQATGYILNRASCLLYARDSLLISRLLLHKWPEHEPDNSPLFRTQFDLVCMWSCTFPTLHLHDV